MVGIEKTNRREMDAKLKTKFFGVICATIDTDQKRISLEYTKRGKGQLDHNHPARCLGWAISALSEYTDDGYLLVCPK